MQKLQSDNVRAGLAARFAGLGVSAAIALSVAIAGAPAPALAEEVPANEATTSEDATASRATANEVSEDLASQGAESVPVSEPTTAVPTENATPAEGKTAEDSSQKRDEKATPAEETKQTETTPAAEEAKQTETTPAAEQSQEKAATAPAGEAEPAGEAAAEVPLAAEQPAAAAVTPAPAADPAAIPEVTPVVATPAAQAQADKTEAVEGKMNVYRLYNPKSDEHLYTKDFNEAMTITAERGWQYEGIGFTASGTKGERVWRLYNTATNLHLWTTDANERNTWLSRGGWNDEGVAWYGAGPFRMIRLYNPTSGQHLYTRDQNEAKVLSTQKGWTREDKAGTWNGGDSSDYVPIKGQWLVSDSWGVQGGRYWVQSNGSIAKNRIVTPSEGTGYTYIVYVRADGTVATNGAHVTVGNNVYVADANGSLTALAPSLRGIDIASYEGDMNVASVDADFVIVKATQGTDYTNPSMLAQANGALSANKLLGFYHYASTNHGGGDPVAEADYFVSTVKDYVGKAVLVLDWEDEVNGNFNSNDSWYVKTFMDRVYEKTGVKGLVYASRAVVARNDFSATANAGYGLWVAQYLYYDGSNQYPGYVDEPMTTHSSYTWSNGMTGDWATPTIYQYTSEGYVNGYGAPVDLNKFYGDANAWRKLASKR